MKTENCLAAGCLGEDRVEPEGTREAWSTATREHKDEGGVEDLFERFLSRENLNRAFKRVRSNGGSPLCQNRCRV